MIYNDCLRVKIVALRSVPDAGTTITTAIPIPIGITSDRNAKSRDIIFAISFICFCSKVRLHQQHQALMKVKASQAQAQA